jgi:cell division protein ZapD
MVANCNNLASQQALTKSVTYEQPLNERIRACLRLEFLFQQAVYALNGHTALDSRQTLTSIIDILNVLSRSDLKTELVKEMEKQAASLSHLKDVPGVDHGQLDSILDELSELSEKLLGINGAIGQNLRNNELLSTIRNRTSIPGGACDFDLPLYHYWLEQPSELRHEDLKNWMHEFTPVIQSTNLILHLIRESSLPSQEVAVNGMFQKNLGPASGPCQLIRVNVPANLPYFPEISASKHRFSIRFMQLHMEKRPTQASEDVSFDLTCCAI